MLVSSGPSEGSHILNIGGWLEEILANPNDKIPMPECLNEQCHGDTSVKARKGDVWLLLR